jgi:hypothetical protein
MDVTQIQRLIKQHIWGPVGSVIFHVIIVGMLLVFASAPPPEAAPEVEVTMMETKADVLEEVMKTEIEKVEPPPVQDEVAVERPDVATVSTMDVPSDAPGSGAGNAEGAGIGSGDATMAAGFEVAMAKSPLVMKGLYSGRTAGGRKGALSAFGGSSRGEDAVLRALRWFKANQSDDGSFSKGEASNPLAFTGLALLAFLAHGETPASQEFGQTVEKAMKYVVSKQQASGAFSGNSYEHAICTYAISEGYGLTKIMALKEAMDKGIKIIVDGQQTGGGYDYGYAKKERWDLSVAGWQFQAMKAAKMAGCSNPKLEDAIKKGMDFLTDIAYDPKGGGFGYSSPNSTPSMTSAGTLCLQLMGKPNAPQVRTALKYLEDMACVWAGGKKAEKANPGANADAKAATQPVYTWYYATQAKFQKGEKDWASWNPRFTKTLVQNQIVEGTLGHWEGGDHGGAVYTTALCCLMLEVYYRYLPTFKHVEGEKAAPSATKSDDVVVDVI